MKLLIIGATGRLGRELARRAAGRGHQTTALVRDTSRVMRQDERLRVVQGNVLDPGLVESAVRGQDAVVSALGTQDPRRQSTLLS